MEKITLIIALFLAVSCTTNSIQYVAAAIDTSGTQPTEIYFINPTLEGGLSKGDIYIDNMLVGLMGSDSYLMGVVEGVNEQEVNIRTKLGQEVDFDFVVSPGETYYFQYDVVTGPSSRKALLRVLNEADGRALKNQVSRAPIYK